MTTTDRAALGERAARALSAWGLGDGFDKLHALIVEWGVAEVAIEREACAVVVSEAVQRRSIDPVGLPWLAERIRARGTESKTGGR